MEQLSVSFQFWGLVFLAAVSAWGLLTHNVGIGAGVAGGIGVLALAFAYVYARKRRRDTSAGASP